jgi:O-antigen ligase
LKPANTAGNGFSKKSNKTQMIRIKQIGFFCTLLPFFLTLATVFIINNSLANGVTSGKYFWFYGSMGVVGITLFIRVFICAKLFRFSPTDILVLLFAGSVYLSALLFNHALHNITKLTLFALLVVLYFGFRGIINNSAQKSLKFLCLFIILTGLIEAVWGLQQLYGFKVSQHGLFRLTGSFFNPGPYAGYLAVVFPLALHEFMAKPNNAFMHSDKRESKRIFRVFQYVVYIPKWVSGVACAAIILVLPAAMSRAAWLALMAGSALVIYAHCAKKPALRAWFAKYKKIIRAASYTAIIVLLTALVGMYLLKKDSADGRLLIWKMSLQAVAKHPSGVGLGNFASAYGDAQAAYFAEGNASETGQYVAGNPEYGFNEFLQIAVESGILSVCLFIGLLIVAFRRLAKVKNWGIMGALLALCVFACFSYPFSVLPFPILLVFLLAASAVKQQNEKAIHQAEQTNKMRLNSRYLHYIGALLCLIVVMGCLWKQYPVYRAYRQWGSHRLYFGAGMYKQTVQQYTPFYPLLNDQIQFLFEYAQSLSKSEQPAQSNEILQRAMQISCDPMLYNIMGKNYQAMKAYKQAESCLIKSTQIVPHRIYPWYLLMRLYDEMGLPEKACETAAVVETKEPKVQSQAVREMRDEAKKICIKQYNF